MKKLSLDFSELKVESFETFVADGDRGTVRANGSCQTWSCGGTCGADPGSLFQNGLWMATKTVCPQCCV
ncbi:MAG TPA: hypothetical protein VJT67_10410 [Longimicrobiaceae bacterium]|nr:hypothetical protein [Longimicrobiaceae bacterium]